MPLVSRPCTGCNLRAGAHLAPGPRILEPKFQRHPEAMMPPWLSAWAEAIKRDVLPTLPGSSKRADQGSGKAEEFAIQCREANVDTVIFDDELSPAQSRNLEQLFDCKVLDRTALILDIFAQRARTREGKLQVELAQLRYRLPRLRGKGGSLSQQGGGIGTRGPGETKLEVDRRRILTRVHRLESQLKELAKVRATQRKGRARNRQAAVTLVG